MQFFYVEDTARLSRKRVMQIMSPTVPGAKIMKSDSIDSGLSARSDAILDYSSMILTNQIG